MELVEELCIEIPEVKELLEIKGIRLTTVSGFLAEVWDVRRFKSPKHIQKLAGLALRESSSGKHKGQIRISKRGRRRLRAILFQGVMPLVSKTWNLERYTGTIQLEVKIRLRRSSRR